uniref:Dynein light intermediate chain n=1 Tax=Lotharella globosa TaxID=91324 RepID=A0A6U3CJL6_9EUKA
MAEAKEKRQNTWEALLRRAIQRRVYTDSTLIVLGDTNCGKSSLLKSFQGIVRNQEHPYVADYSYIKVKNRHEVDSDETLAHMAVWQLDKPSRKELIPTFLKSSGLERAVFMVVLDLSQPWNIDESLKTWLKVAEDISKQLMKEMEDEEAKALKMKVSRYVQTFTDVSMRDNTEAKDLNVLPGETKIDPYMPDINTGTPLIVVGAKGDYFSNYLQKSSTAGDRFEFASRRLRQAALKYGASLIFTSVAGEGTNMQLLQDYIFHRMYGFEMKQPANAACTVDSFGLYIPSGFDSIELIDTVRSEKSPFSDDMEFSKVYPNPNQESKRRTEEEKVKAMKNSQFYRLLQQKLSGGSRSVTRSSESRSPRQGGPRGRHQPTKSNHAVRQFFQSLLTGTGKKAAKPGDPAAKPEDKPPPANSTLAVPKK